MTDAKDEMTGVMSEIEESLAFVADSIREANTDAEVMDAKATMLAYIAKQREMLSEIEALIAERTSG